EEADPDGPARTRVSVNLSEDVSEDVSDGEKELRPTYAQRPDGAYLGPNQIRDQQDYHKDMHENVVITEILQTGMACGELANQDIGHRGFIILHYRVWPCHSDSPVTSGRFLRSASNEGRICSAQTAAGADPSGPIRELKKALANNGPLGMTNSKVSSSKNCTYASALEA